MVHNSRVFSPVQKRRQRAGGPRRPFRRAQSNLISLPSASDRRRKAPRHPARILGDGYGRVYQDGVGTHFHRFRRMAGPANPGIDNHWDGRLIDDYAELVPSFQAAIGANRRTQGHHRRRAGVLQSLGKHGVRVDVGQHDEAFAHQDFRRGQRFDRVRQQIARIGVDFQLDPFGQSGGGGQVRQADGFGGVAGSAGIGQKQITFRINVLEDIGERIRPPLKSARRNATVTMSAPLAAIASRINSGDANLPVPASSREPNSRPAICNVIVPLNFQKAAWAASLEV